MSYIPLANSANLNDTNILQPYGLSKITLVQFHSSQITKPVGPSPYNSLWSHPQIQPSSPVSGPGQVAQQTFRGLRQSMLRHLRCGMRRLWGWSKRRAKYRLFWSEKHFPYYHLSSSKVFSVQMYSTSRLSGSVHEERKDSETSKRRQGNSLKDTGYALDIQLKISRYALHSSNPWHISLRDLAVFCPPFPFDSETPSVQNFFPDGQVGAVRHDSLEDSCTMLYPCCICSPFLGCCQAASISKGSQP